jgi:hypothetical protein
MVHGHAERNSSATCVLVMHVNQHDRHMARYMHPGGTFKSVPPLSSDTEIVDAFSSRRELFDIGDSRFGLYSRFDLRTGTWNLEIGTTVQTDCGTLQQDAPQDVGRNDP